MQQKELISIGAHCPDSDTKNLLLTCLKSLQSIRDKYDILVVTHIPLENYIYDYVDYVFFDKNNDMIYDLEYLNLPWFAPTETQKITSPYITASNTYLAAYRLFIANFGIAKTMGYSKIHWLEYDSEIADTEFFKINSQHLNTHVAVQYTENNSHNYLQWGYGCVQSINIEKLNSTFLTYNKKHLLQLLSNTPNKTCESITEDIYLIDGEKIYKENLNVLLDKGNKFNLSKSLPKNEMDNWVVPYYNKYNNTLEGIGWNNRFSTPINANFIINNTKIVDYNQIPLNSWEIKPLGNMDEINTIHIIFNDQIKLKIDFSLIDKELFKIKSFLINPKLEN